MNLLEGNQGKVFCKIRIFIKGFHVPADYKLAQLSDGIKEEAGGNQG